MRASAIVPQKALALAKGRLGAVLRSEARAALSLQFLRRVCITLRAVGEVEDLVVMTPDPMVQAHATAWGMRAIFDPGPELNAALAAALAERVNRSRATLIVAGDLPFLRPADIAALLSAVGPHTLGLAPAKGGTGTNAMLIPAGVRIHPAYGDGSLTAHRRRACALGLRVVEVMRPGLAFDIDSPADLAVLEAAGWTGCGHLGPAKVSGWRI